MSVQRGRDQESRDPSSNDKNPLNVTHLSVNRPFQIATPDLAVGGLAAIRQLDRRSGEDGSQLGACRPRIHSSGSPALRSASNRQGFGWTRWSREWTYNTLGLFKGYRGCTTSAESRPGRIGPICLEAKQTGERSARKSACCVRRGGGWKGGMVEMV